MNPQQIQILRDILHRTTASYMTIRPHGIDPGNNRKPLPNLDCRILNFSAAKTLYLERRPVCRSLDAVKAFGKSDVYCRQCPNYQRCTDQIRLELLFENRPYRLLIAYTSAKNFLIYTSKIAVQKIEVHTIDTKLVVINRGSWGELRFYRADIATLLKNGSLHGLPGK